MIKILIADSHPIILKGLELQLSASPNIKIEGRVNDGEAVIDFVKKVPVDIILMEIDLPKLNGLTVLQILKSKFPSIKTIIFSAQPEEVYAINVIKAGAAGYISKAVNLITINEAILKVNEGAIYLSDELNKELNFGKKINRSGSFYKKLSMREVEVLKLLSTGKKIMKLLRS